MKKKLQGNSEIILYQTEDGKTRLDVRLENETVWLTQGQMAELFQTTVPNISMHIRNVFKEGELQKNSTIKDFLTVQKEGQREVTRSIEYYNLDVIISVGYRVKSLRGTQFRIWATQRLREYLIKGFTMDDERLKNPPDPAHGIPDYFDELLERIRDIRASERRMYLRVREILALAADYEPKDEETQIFFQTVQNKLHYAVTGKTAPELIMDRADSSKSNMGLTAWKGGRVLSTDVTVAKNYLKEEEIAGLNRIVSMFLDFAEDQAERRKQIFMRDWREKLDEFLRFNEREVLDNLGDVSREDADAHAKNEYQKFAAKDVLLPKPPAKPKSSNNSNKPQKIFRRGKRERDRKSICDMLMKYESSFFTWIGHLGWRGITFNKGYYENSFGWRD